MDRARLGGSRRVDVADLAEEADQVTVLQHGRIAFTGRTREFLAHAPRDTSEARRAETA
ncbi:hypothetical protein [Streptomyces sp. NPDC003393]